jgi:hypothetical protein
MKTKNTHAIIETEKQNQNSDSDHLDDRPLFSEVDVIFSYSRAEAIRDGVLIDVSETAREAGIRYPVALTSAAWHTCVELPTSDLLQDETGRLWDVLNVLRSAPAHAGSSEIRFIVDVADTDYKMITPVDLKAICGPGDTAEPVITIMLPDED